VERMVRIICLSDTHELHRELVVPPGDILIHAGDFTFFSRRRSQIRDFDDWLGELPHAHKIVIPGNHEFAFEADPKLRDLITNADVLIDETLKVAGLSIWGSPVTPLGMSSPADRKRHWARIPDDVNILVTHGPPHGILDAAGNPDLHEGCPELLQAVVRLKPKLHVFGHIHAGYGTHRTAHTTFVNAALFGEFGELERAPIVINLSLP